MSESKQVDRFGVRRWLDNVHNTVVKRRDEKARETAIKLRKENITDYNWFQHQMGCEAEEHKIVFDAAWEFAMEAVKIDKESASPKDVNFCKVFDAAYNGAIMLVFGRKTIMEISSLFDDDCNLIIH
jgi:hypothetical protein